MLSFFKRLLGVSEEHKAAEERYRKQLAKLEKREEELEAISVQLKEVSDLQVEKKAELSKTSIDLSATLSHSSVVNCDREESTDEEQRHPPKEPSYALG